MRELPEGWNVKPEQETRTHERTVIVITHPDGRRVSFFSDGGMRVYNPNHDVDTIRPQRRIDAGTSVDISFTARED